MTTVTFADGTLQVDADVVAAGLQITPDALRSALQHGSVTSKCEKGEGDDTGRFRLTFYAPNRRLRLVVDAGGAVLQQSSADFTRRVPYPKP